MKRGRKPVPTELKKLLGVAPERINNLEPAFSAEQDFRPPFYFDTYAEALWMAVFPELAGKAALKITDRTTLETFCTSYGMFRGAFEDVKKRGRVIVTKNGYEQENPSVNTMHKFMVLHNKCAAELGLTPSSRSRIIGAVAEKTTGGIKDFMASGFRAGENGINK